jgi:hypothetical protein
MLRTSRFTMIFVFVIFIIFSVRTCFANTPPNQTPGPDGEKQKQAEKQQFLTSFEKDAYNATGLLYAFTEDGSLRMYCTATLISDPELIPADKNIVASAAHCVSEDDTQKEIAVAVGDDWFFTFDNKPENPKVFFPAKIIGIGYQSRGDDFSVFEINPNPSMLENPIVKIPLGQNPTLNEVVINIASPNGLGKQLFRGYVTSENLDRPVKQGSINWKGGVLVHVVADPGSSGSAVISVSQKGIVSFLVGGISNTIVTIPVDRFKKFLRELKENKYEYFDPKKSVDTSKSKTTMQQKWNKLQEKK